METIEIFYLNKSVYFASGTSISSIYKVKTKERYDWGFLQTDLEKGYSIVIRQANAEELKWALDKLATIKSH